MEDFKCYLQQNNYRESTIAEHLRNVIHFLKWFEGPSFGGVGEAVSYNDLLSYIQYEQQRDINVSTINLRISSISKYFEFLKEENIINRNPARTLRIKGKTKTIIENPLQYEELLQLYTGYKSMQKVLSAHLQLKSNLAHQRNVVILGMMIWQGLHTETLSKMEVSHVHLNEGMIYIPGTARSNSRELKLSAQQILTLHSYIHGDIREQLQHAANNNKQSKMQQHDETLFFGNMNNIIGLLTKELQGINLQIKNAQHIRASVILHWLRQHNKRQVQYMAGHRYINSTEKYEVQEMETLIDQLQKHHPFG